MRIDDIASNAKYRKNRWGSKFEMTKCRMTDISESQNFLNFLEIVWTPKVFDNFSNFKIWIFQIVKLWKLNNFKNSIISQINQL